MLLSMLPKRSVLSLNSVCVCVLSPVSSSCHARTWVPRLQERRRSSVVVSLPGLDVSPGDLFVSNGAADILNRSTYSGVFFFVFFSGDKKVCCCSVVLCSMMLCKPQGVQLSCHSGSFQNPTGVPLSSYWAISAWPYFVLGDEHNSKI